MTTRYLPDADEGVVGRIERGILFQMAFWSAPAVCVAFATLTAVVARMDPDGAAELVVVDIDGAGRLSEVSDTSRYSTLPNLAPLLPVIKMVKPLLLFFGIFLMSTPSSNEFRTSRFADFNAGTVFETPDTLFQIMPDPLRLEDKFDLFECRVEVWQLAPAVAILKQIESHTQPSVWCHTAYALVAILTSYFEMIGKTVNPDSKARGTASKDFDAGFQDVYPHFVFTDDDGNRKPSGTSETRETASATACITWATPSAA